MTIIDTPVVSESGVLIKALANVCAELNLSQAKLALVLGVSPATVSRVFDGQETKAISGKTAELAILLLRIFRSLDSIFDNQAYEREWLSSYNRGLGGRPADLITSAEGLVNVLGYLETQRAGL